MKRVLHIVSCLELGGTEAFIMNNYREINRNEVQFDFLVLTQKEYPYIKEIQQLGGNVYFGVWPTLKNIVKFYRIFKNVIKQGGNYSTVHCHLNEGNALPLLCAKLCGIKKRISHSHATPFIPLSKLKKIIFVLRKITIKLCGNTFLACSRDAGKWLYVDDFFGKFGQVINNGIDITKFLYIESDEIKKLKKEFDIIQKNNIIVGNISRFDATKNQLFILDVFEEILKKEPNAILVLGGVDGGQLQEIIEKVNVLGITKNVRFIGSRTDVPVCLKLIDIYLFPSLSEGLGIALLEAQAAGCNCFASTGVSKESDMGINRVEYYPLSDGAEVWAERIIEKHKEHFRLNSKEIISAFTDKEYTIDASVQKLKGVYDA